MKTNLARSQQLFDANKIERIDWHLWLVIEKYLASQDFTDIIYQSIHQSDFYSANIPAEARLKSTQNVVLKVCTRVQVPLFATKGSKVPSCCYITKWQWCNLPVVLNTEYEGVLLNWLGPLQSFACFAAGQLLPLGDGLPMTKTVVSVVCLLMAAAQTASCLEMTVH